MDILLANCPASIPPKVALPFDGEEIDLRELIEEIVVTVPSPIQREHTAPVERSAQGDVIQDCREIFSTLILSPLEVPLDCDLLEDRISILTERIEMLNQDHLFQLTKGKTAFFKRLHNFAEGLQTILSSRTMLIEAYAKAETFLKQRERAVMERVSARMDPLDWPRYAGNVVPPPMGRRRQEIGDALKAKRPYASRKQFVPRGGVTILHNWVRDSNDFVHSLRLSSGGEHAELPWVLSRGTFVKEDKDKDGKLVRVGEWVRVDELKPTVVCPHFASDDICGIALFLQRMTRIRTSSAPDNNNQGYSAVRSDFINIYDILRDVRETPDQRFAADGML